MATTSPDRIITLDIVRGIAVMGILAMNIIAFTMPPIAYFNPLSYGFDGTEDVISWAFSFIFVDGKMRGLFSFLFGASLAIIAESAARSGKSEFAAIGARHFWLLVIGLLHLFFLWFGDILSHYAIVGTLAYLFRNKSAGALIKIGIAILVVQFLMMGFLTFGIFAMAQMIESGNAPADIVEQWEASVGMFLKPGPAEIAATLDTYRGTYSEIVNHTVATKGWSPITFLFIFGLETLAYMLFGMAALKSGFLTGAWDKARYKKWIVTGLAIAVPAMAFFAYQQYQNGFVVTDLYLYVMTLTIPFRPLMIVAYAAIIILLTRNGGAFVDRIAATGRAAFSNYLGTSLVMTFVFYGWGLGYFGSIDRAATWIPVIGMWALMLLWSKPWLDRFNYGPMEWLWRSLSRFSLQPMRKNLAA